MTRFATTCLLFLTLLCPAVGGARNLDEAAIAERLRQLLDAPVLNVDRDWVESLLDYQEQQRLPHPERDSLSLPRHGIRALAHAVQRRWQLEDARGELERFKHKRRALPDNAIQAKARAQWLSSVDTQALAGFRAMTPANALDEAALRILLTRDGHWSEWQQLARIGNSRQAMQLLGQARQQLSTARYLALLELAEQNPALSSHAARLHGELGRSEPAVHHALLDRLRHAPLDRSLMESALTARLEGLEDILAQRLAEHDQAPMAAWGLWQLDTHSARQRLRQYVSAPQTLPHLREELLRWLD